MDTTVARASRETVRNFAVADKETPDLLAGGGSRRCSVLPGQALEQRKSVWERRGTLA